MRLRDLVANSLPRMRGRKKKSPPLPGSEGNPGGCQVVEKCQHRYSSGGHFVHGEDVGVERMALAEASWRGNALYRGMEAGRRGVDVSGGRVMTQSYTSHGLVTSHSAEGFPSGMMMMSRSYDARMAVSEYGGSSTQISAVCETACVPVTSQHQGQLQLQQQQQQQYYHCYVHKHNHQHYHHHHHHHHVPPSQPMKQLTQNQQVLSSSSSSHPQPFQTHKSEPGFFRKSIASFRGIRKQSSKSSKDKGGSGKQGTSDGMRCSVCPYPEASANVDRKSSDKRPAKPKRKGLKGFSRSKENAEVVSGGAEKCDKLWFSDNEGHYSLGPRMPCDNSGPYHVTRDRSRTRECSVESCSSRLYSSRESSCVRETDLAGFDSASLSGYESDLPRTKVHRSRSRIKTNPWLPSPQPSLSGGRRAESCDLRESREDMMLVDDVMSRTVPRSASFECQRRPTLQMFTGEETGVKTPTQRHRALTLTPSSQKTTHNLDDTLNFHSHYEDKEIPSSSTPTSATQTRDAMNDLSSEPSRSRPTSIVSPNSEFVMLADNIEQLANNISFEYEDLLDSTLESVSACPEDGQASIQELLTDEDSNGANSTTTSVCGVGKGKTAGSNGNLLKCTTDLLNNAHSPDSGVGGLGSSDGDDLTSPNGQPGGKTAASMDCSFPEIPPGAFSLTPSPSGGGVDHHSFLSLPHNALSSFKPRNAVVSPSVGGSVDNIGSPDGKFDSTPFRPNIRKQSTSGESEACAAVCESDIDNTSYQDTSSLSRQGSGGKKSGSPLLKCKTEATTNPTSALMVNERLDVPFQPVQRRNLTGSGIVMGALASGHDFRSNSPMSKRQMTRLSDPSDKMASSSSLSPSAPPRPTVLRPSKQAQRSSRRLNNMEKTSPHNEQGRPWSDEFDFPRNITFSDCIESPTDNFQCEGQFLRAGQGAHGASFAVRTDQFSDQHLMLFEDPYQTQEGENFLKKDARQSETLVLDLKTSREEEEERELCNLMDFNPDRRDIETSDVMTVSDMADACCQTDFDDEFLPWDSESPLEALDQSALDPSETTRLWLLTGNMQDSVDTGYSSLARDSRVITDDDVLVLTSEQDDVKGSERLSFTKTCSRPGSQHRDTISPSRHTPTSNLAAEKSGLVLPTCLPFDDRTLASSSKNDSLLQNSKNSSSSWDELADIDINGNPEICPISTSTIVNEHSSSAAAAAKSISSDTVNDMFSNIESQFQEIFQQMYKNGKQMSGQHGKNDLSDSSDSTLKSDGSRHSASDIDLDPSMDLLSSKRGQLASKSTTDSSDFASSSEVLDSFLNHVYVNVPHLKPKKDKSAVERGTADSRNGNKDLVPQQQSRPNYVNCDPSSSALASLCCQSQTRQGEADGVSCVTIADDVTMNTPPSADLLTSASTDAATSCQDNKADYLEFLRDAPLERSHLKRPLFLVPGVGPVDMSGSDRVTLVADDTSVSGDAKHKGNPQTSALLAYASPTSSFDRLYGKKFKSRKDARVVVNDIYFMGSSSINKCSNSSKPYVPNRKTQYSSVCSQSVASSPHTLSTHARSIPAHPASLPLFQTHKSHHLPNVHHHHHQSLFQIRREDTKQYQPSYQHHHYHPHPASTNHAFRIPADRMPKPPPPSPPPSSYSPLLHRDLHIEAQSTSLALETLMTLRDDQETRSLAERVMVLRQEKDLVYRQIQEAQQDEMSRKQQQQQHQQLQQQRDLHVQRKQALLESLQELKRRLEEQSKKLAQSGGKV